MIIYYDPHQYPIILPKGEWGWHKGIRKCHNQINNNQTTPSTTVQTGRSTQKTAAKIFANEAQGSHILL